MKRIARFLMTLAIITGIALTTSGCFRQDYLMFEDGDFDGVEFSDYDLMHNAELEQDDVDHD